MANGYPSREIRRASAHSPRLTRSCTEPGSRLAPASTPGRSQAASATPAGNSLPAFPAGNTPGGVACESTPRRGCPEARSWSGHRWPRPRILRLADRPAAHTRPSAPCRVRRGPPDATAPAAPLASKRTPSRFRRMAVNHRADVRAAAVDRQVQAQLAGGPAAARSRRDHAACHINDAHLLGLHEALAHPRGRDEDTVGVEANRVVAFVAVAEAAEPTSPADFAHFLAEGFFGSVDGHDRNPSQRVGGPAVPAGHRGDRPLADTDARSGPGFAYPAVLGWQMP